MRFQDTLRFSLELVLPEKVVRAFEKVKYNRLSGRTPSQPLSDAFSSNDLRHLIEDIDRERYGGLSFGPETIALMVSGLARAIESSSQPMGIKKIRELARCILAIASEGERNPDHLRIKALIAFEQLNSEAVSISKISSPPATSPETQNDFGGESAS